MKQKKIVPSTITTTSRSPFLLGERGHQMTPPTNNAGQQKRRQQPLATMMAASFLAQATTTASLFIDQRNNRRLMKTTPLSFVSSVVANEAAFLNASPIVTDSAASTSSDNSDVVEQSFSVAILLGFFTFATIIGNASLLICIFAEKAFRTSTNFFVASLTAASMLVGFVIMPLAIYLNLSSQHGQLVSQSSMIACELWLFFDFTVSAVIIFNIVCICFVRYLAIAHPLFYSRGHHQTFCICAPIAVWPVCMIVAASRFFLLPKTQQEFVRGYICTAESSPESAVIFVPIDAFLFFGGNLAASVILLLIRRALVKRANEVVERRYSVAAQSAEIAVQNHAEAKLAQILNTSVFPPPQLASRTSDLENGFNNSKPPDVLKRPVGEETCIRDNTVFVKNVNTDDENNGDTDKENDGYKSDKDSVSPTLSDSKTKRRRWITSVVARRKMSEHFLDRSHRPSIGTIGNMSVGLDTIASAASQHQSSLTVSLTGEQDGPTKIPTLELTSPCRTSYKFAKSSLCKSEERLSFLSKQVSPSTEQPEKAVVATKRQSVGHVQSLSPEDIRHGYYQQKPPVYRQMTASVPTESPPLSPLQQHGRRFSKPNCALSRGSNFHKSERRLSVSDDQNQLMIHRPKSASVYRRNHSREENCRASLSDKASMLSSGENLPEPNIALTIAQQIKSASSAMSVLVFEQLGGNDIARHISSGVRGDSLGNIQIPSKTNNEKQRSKSLAAAIRLSATESSSASSVGQNYNCHGRRFSCRSYRSGMSSRGLSIANLSMAIDGLVEGFLSEGVKATATLIMLVVLFSLCGLPSVIVEVTNFVCRHLSDARHSCVSDWTVNMAMWMSFCYNALNPLVYFSFNAQLRATLCRCFYNPSANLRKVFSSFGATA